MKEKLDRYHKEMEREVRQNILDFWMQHTVDRKNDGFYGFVSRDLEVGEKAHKGLVLHARILWSFSLAYRKLRDEKYRTMARRAYAYLIEHFVDEEFSGAYWMVDYNGKPVDTKKQVYGIAFCIYAFAEYYRATGEAEALGRAIEFYHILEGKSRDDEAGGYFEAFSREWLPLTDMSLSEKDMNCAKSMNTHLHVMEAYTNLFRVWKDERVQNSLRQLIHITMDRILHRDSKQFQLFFDALWKPLASIISYGHDIEGSWLLQEAAEVLGEKFLLQEVKSVSLAMAQKVYDEGWDRRHGGVFNEKEGEHLDTDKIWWVQTEAMVGFLNAYQLGGGMHFLEASLEAWEFSKKYLIDKVHGEWIWKCFEDGEAGTEPEKVGPWKCPYHNTRACFEIMERIAALQQL